MGFEAPGRVFAHNVTLGARTLPRGLATRNECACYLRIGTFVTEVACTRAPVRWAQSAVGGTLGYDPRGEGSIPSGSTGRAGDKPALPVDAVIAVRVQRFAMLNAGRNRVQYQGRPTASLVCSGKAPSLRWMQPEAYRAGCSSFWARATTRVGIAFSTSAEIPCRHSAGIRRTIALT